MDRNEANKQYELAAKAIRELGDGAEIDELASIINRCFDAIARQPGTNKKVGPLLVKMTNLALHVEREWYDK